jgi:hypothetical protein
VDVATGAAVANDDAVSTVVPPSSTKDEGAYVGVSVASEGACVGGQGRHRCLRGCRAAVAVAVALPLPLPRHPRHYTAALMPPPPPR